MIHQLPFGIPWMTGSRRLYTLYGNEVSVMINSLKFSSGYPTRLKGIKRRTITFGPRINVLNGPNGSGKTTILKTLAVLSGCGEGGWSEGNESGELPYQAVMERDGQPVFYQDCYKDSETSFIGDGYLETHDFLRSSGEKRVGLINELVRHIEDRFLTYKLPREVRPTLLLDEVDNHVGFAGQSLLWGGLFAKLSKKYQLILSTHSIFPILLRRENLLGPDNIIDLADNYAEICVAELGRAIGFFNQENADSGADLR